MILWFVTVHQTRPVVSEPWPGGEHGRGREAATARGETPGGQREERPTEMSAGPAAVRGRVRSAVLSCDSAGVCVTVTHKVGQIQTSRCFIFRCLNYLYSFSLCKTYLLYILHKRNSNTIFKKKCHWCIKDLWKSKRNGNTNVYCIKILTHAK